MRDTIKFIMDDPFRSFMVWIIMATLGIVLVAAQKGLSTSGIAKEAIRNCESGLYKVEGSTVTCYKDLPVTN